MGGLYAKQNFISVWKAWASKANFVYRFLILILGRIKMFTPKEKLRHKEPCAVFPTSQHYLLVHYNKTTYKQLFHYSNLLHFSSAVKITNFQGAKTEGDEKGKNVKIQFTVLTDD